MMTIKIERIVNMWAIYEIMDGSPVRYVILSDDDMKELASMLKVEGK
jgi:hypothetical protein